MKPGVKVDIAIRILLHEKKRLSLSIMAVSFAVLVIFMEQGFYNGLNDSQVKLYDVLNADLVIMNSMQRHMHKYDMLRRSSLYQALGVEGVTEAVPVYKFLVQMKNSRTGDLSEVFGLAFPPESNPLTIPIAENDREALKKLGTVLFDSDSRKNLGQVVTGQEIEINGLHYNIGGFIRLGPTFSFDGNILMSEGTWLMDKDPGYAEHVSFGLLRAAPGVDIQALKEKIRGEVNEDVTLLTPYELRRREIIYTTKTAPLGSIFGVGMIIGFIIGTIICYQILYNQITDHIPQFATLKAMGFTDKYLRNLVLRQTVLLSLIGFIPGLFLTQVLYYFLFKLTGIAMLFTVVRVAIVLSMTFGMCVISGFIAVKKIIRADPADLF
jgi:putative ABC transport system permease protein